jgi:hypothetical protein
MLKNVFTYRKRYLYVKKMLKNDGTIALYQESIFHDILNDFQECLKFAFKGEMRRYIHNTE